MLSVGSLSDDSPIANYGFIRPSELEELKAAGAVGDILCHFVDAEGAAVDHDVNRRVCAYPLEDLTDIPNIVLVSGGPKKSRSCGPRSSTNVSVLITDEDAAKGLLG